MVLEEVLNAVKPRPLKSVNVVIHGRRTSMRLEPTTWDALNEVARWERLSTNELCSLVAGRINQRPVGANEVSGSREEVEPMEGNEETPSAKSKEVTTFTTAIRAFIMDYYRRLARPGARSGDDNFEGDTGSTTRKPPDADNG